MPKLKPLDTVKVQVHGKWYTGQYLNRVKPGVARVSINNGGIEKVSTKNINKIKAEKEK